MEHKYRNLKGWLLGSVVGLVLVGMFTNLIYDIVVRPGIYVFQSKFREIITLGSQRLDDGIYRSAALDPTPVTGLFILLLFSIAPVIVVEMFTFLILGRVRRHYTSLKGKKIKEEQGIQKYTEWVRLVKRTREKRKAIVSCIGLVFSIALLSISIYIFFLHNQSVLVWRVFSNNITIIEPYINNDECLKLKSRFARIKNSKDYIKLLNDMKVVANKNGIELEYIRE